jgi:parallel beta-helix repeat protein
LTNHEVILKAGLTQVDAQTLSLPIGTFQPPLSPPKRVVWRGSKTIEKDFRVRKDETLVIEPGTRIEFDEGASLLSYGKISARGTPTHPITFTRVPRAPSWGVVALQGHQAHGSIFEYCTFEHASEDEIDRVVYSGALSIYNADAIVKKCVFRANQGDDALNTKFSSTDVVECTFAGNSADAYDLDFSSGLVARNVFEGNENDGIDCGGAHPTIKDNRILRCGDKGISIGERSKPLVEGNLIAYCTIGIAVKDRSSPEIKNNEFVSNGIAVSAYQKKEIFGGADCTIQDSIFRNNARVSAHDALSSISFEACTFEDVAAGRYE